MRINDLKSIKYLIEEYEELDEELESMSEAWESGDPAEMAANDPSDQYIKGSELGEKLDEITSAMKEFLQENER